MERVSAGDDENDRWYLSSSTSMGRCVVFCQAVDSERWMGEAEESHFGDERSTPSKRNI